MPEDAEDIISGHITHWVHLSEEEQDRLLELTEWLLLKKSWEAANGFALDDTIRVVIAAQAALLILGLSTDHYGQVTAIIVHPSTSVHRGVRAGPVAGTVTDDDLPIHGLAQARRGPVVISWDQARSAARHPERGHNVVFHEFAHKLDMLDGVIDGTPPLRRAEADEWVRICTDAFQDLQAGRPRPPLRDYGAVNAGEFFAVATEAFFDVPDAMSAQEPDLYRVLSGFYQQDPASRVAS
ncbi:MAG: M90 family metallopeptidase [Iamia sp.]